jgi:hypothetical protein
MRDQRSRILESFSYSLSFLSEVELANNHLVSQATVLL